MPNGANNTNEAAFIQKTPEYLTFVQFNTISQYRFDWANLIVWMRYYTNARILNDPGLATIAKRLYEGVPLSFYNSLKVFLGPVRAQEFANKLSLFISTYFQYVEAQISKDVDEVNRITAELYAMLEDMASFLGSLSPFWTSDIWDTLFRQYLSMTFDRVTSYQAGNYDLAIQIDDRLLYHAIIMGDYMARGIIAEYALE